MRVRALRWGLGLLAAVLIVAGASGCAADQTTGRIGEPLSAGDYQITVTNMENPAQPPDRFTNPRPGNRLVKFDLAMNNTGGLHLPLWASYFTLRDSAGTESQPRTDVTGDQYLKQRDVPPGASLQTTLYFEMAANQRPERLVFHPQVLGWRTRIEVQLGS